MYRRHVTRTIAVATVLFAVLGVAATPVVVAAPTPNVGTDFYRPPVPLPVGAPGDVLRTAPSVDALIPGTGAVIDARVTRVMYLSQNVKDQPVAVTGTLLVPTRPWTGKRPRPVVAMAPGTQGMGDQCAPSKLMVFGQEYENLQIGLLLASGYSVALTDYMGLGTPGVHPYLNRVDAGRALLDIARAAGSMGSQGVSRDAPIALWGYSQGGQASGAAAELASSYAPELPFVGAFVGAPAPDLNDLAEYGDRSVLSGGIGWVISGFVAAYPEHARELLSVFNARGRELLYRSQSYCVFNALQMNPFGSTTDYTRDGRSISAYLRTEPLKSLTAAQTLGNLTPSMPVYVGQNLGDDLVAARGTLRLQRAWCSRGVTVESANLPLPQILPKTALGHVLGLATVAPALQWLQARFSGTEPPSNC
ncbi:lipase family protein [Williamsia phyllosphaerae]|uniref:Lipase n=1 Tax=Williamsia phyllosphaerae TaxID=885042 RepID=A0ABQ1UZV7_9NOCA|nr:lipase family protein [Williamsia phyllosphaerae]GGF31676.1 lipase [Williamsia phyllosphaerae]